jgi:hypothetical protein
MWTVLGHSEEEVKFSYKGADYVRRTVVAHGTAFAAALRHQQDVVIEECKSNRVVLLRIASDERYLALDNLLPTHTTDGYIQHAAEALRPDKFDFAEFICVTGDAVLRVRHMDGSSRVVVLQGKDPLKLSTRHGTADISWIEYWHDGYDESIVSGDAENLAVLVVATHPTLELARSAFEMLKEKFPRRELRLWIRSSPWIPRVPWFPLLSPFSWPSEDQLKVLREVSPVGFACEEALGQTSCKPETTL